jgi:hypothetical protein
MEGNVSSLFLKQHNSFVVFLLGLTLSCFLENSHVTTYFFFLSVKKGISNKSIIDVVAI